MNIVIFLAKAVLCVSGTCYPALVGKDTAPGAYTLHRRFIEAEGYGGDVLQFDENETSVFAIHRVWLGAPSQHRLQRLASNSPAQRRNITGGCVNVTPDVYDRLAGADTVEIRP